MESKQKAYSTIKELVKRFSEHVDEYKRGSYSETQTRVDFIDPFFIALGWDMYNKQGLSEAYREVIHEYKMKVGGATNAPDYCFTVYGQRKFFVDAKKPSIDVKTNVAPAYQVKRYGWSAKLPIAVVTDFEEFSIYDCYKKPKLTDKSSEARISYLTYDNYLDEFDFIYGTFAKESVLKGSFDKFVLSDTKKKGTATVDNEFLKSIEEWRTYLATTIALRNKSLSEDEINYAVQKTIDRIIFLRICEDRGIEQYGELKNSLKDDTFYERLFKLFRSADEKYNSGLFDFKEDTITPKIQVDNKAIKKIIDELYYPVSPFEFSVLPADILGSVYERFLGKTIRLTKAHYAKIEEKPEVRKAGGVYYTPKYIVDYIVENTVGKLLKGKKPKDVDKLKIVDPACGSGSFLIGAYRYLLDWHLKYYLKNPPSKNKDNPLTPDGNLTTAEKKRILLNNIYGVDIDSQAVEVTKLNLLLKALEGETKASIDKQLTFFNERVLPNLEYNIKCGNSLIGTDFYDEQPGLFTDNIKKINAFDWDKAFPEIFKNGGFDAVIGNPPYVNAKILVELFNTERNYLSNSNSYKTLYQKWDLYIAFIEKGLRLIKAKGIFAMIIPYPFVNQMYGKVLRRNILEKYDLVEIADLSKEKIFKDAIVNNCILFIKNNKSSNKVRISNIEDSNIKFIYNKNNDELIANNDTYIWDTKPVKLSILKERNFSALGDYFFISKGMVLNAD
ncbi:MAG: N-6 DNA methylase, partial [Bacteroidetes bacterium]|nr:N-6 DNA methylase [Bacteroidota bacterium]